jgi:hypothetical protein
VNCEEYISIPFKSLAKTPEGMEQGIIAYIKAEKAKEAEVARLKKIADLEAELTSLKGKAPKAPVNEVVKLKRKA